MSSISISHGKIHGGFIKTVKFKGHLHISNISKSYKYFN